MCSILCISSLWRSEEDAFVNIVTEIVAKYLIWFPFRVHDLPSWSEDGMVSTGPYLTSFLQGWHVSLSSAKKWGKVDPVIFLGRRQRVPKSHVSKITGKDVGQYRYSRRGHHIISFDWGWERERHKSWRIWETLRKKPRRLRKEMKTWTLEDLRSALEKKNSHLKSTRRSCTLNPESYTTLRADTKILIQNHWVSFSTYWND